METLITTSELIDETKKLIGKTGLPVNYINYAKLLRWKEAGLLPEQKPCSAGPGKRQESLWDKSCIERLQIIAGCVKGQRLNRKNAECALIAAGLGVQGYVLKKHFLKICQQMSNDLERRQRNDSSDVVDQASNLERSTRDRMLAHSELVKTIFASCCLGYTGLNKEEEHFKSLARLASLFRPDVLHELVKNANSELLERAYQNSNRVCSESLIQGIFDLICGQSKKLGIPSFDDNPVMAGILKEFAPKPSGKLRRKKPYPYSKDKMQYYSHLTVTLFYLVCGKRKKEFQKMLMQSILEILMWRKLAVPDDIKNLLSSEQEKLNALFSLPSMSK